ncbi:MAG: hypothetical protein ACTSX2_05480 [Candidatus Thorarchaeota archaeon]
MGEKGDMREETDHLIFDFVDFTGKTHIIDVRNRNTGYYIGGIRWFGRWRKYCFFPNPDTVYDSKCLKDISDFLNELMRGHREKKRATANALREKTHQKGGD